MTRKNSFAIWNCFVRDQLYWDSFSQDHFVRENFYVFLNPTLFFGQQFLFDLGFFPGPFFLGFCPGLISRFYRFFLKYFVKIFFTGIILSGSIFSGAILTGTTLPGVILSGTFSSRVAFSWTVLSVIFFLRGCFFRTQRLTE